MNNIIDGTQLRKMILGAASLLEKNKKEVDKLNVFPVPDGDTGSNMALTLQVVAREVAKCSSNTIPDVANAIASGALKGARGNSGVILSQIIKGMMTTLAAANKIDIKTTALAIQAGSKSAYGAVSKPQEGTILTVIKDMATEATKLAKQKSLEFDDFLKGVLDAGKESLARTPDLLPVLKESNVVDSGGQGLLFVFQGFYNVVLGRDESFLDFEINLGLSVDTSKMFHENFNALADIQFAYCTEFFIINLHKKTTQTAITKFKNYLMTIGDCVLVVGDLTLVKVHVHTNDPGLALSAALKLGELFQLKIENMLEQARELAKARTNIKPLAVVAISTGKGFENLFKSVLVDSVVDGGPTMNPSADAIAVACDNVGAHDVLVLPNNKNTILACEQAKQLVKECTIHVLPTVAIPQGINAMIVYNPEESVAINIETMKESIAATKYGAISQASRNTTTNGVTVNSGDYIGIAGNKISLATDSVDNATVELVDSLVSEESNSITLYYGNKVKQEDAQKLAKQIQDKHSNCDVDCQLGDQSVYEYFVSID